jgi:dsRNA-specific ribonuclease
MNIAAIYLDGGILAARQFVQNHILKEGMYKWRQFQQNFITTYSENQQSSTTQLDAQQQQLVTVEKMLNHKFNKEQLAELVVCIHYSLLSIYSSQEVVSTHKS